MMRVLSQSLCLIDYVTRRTLSLANNSLTGTIPSLGLLPNLL